MKPVSVHTLRAMKEGGEKISCLTAYDYSFASLLDRAGLELIMVGDSLGMVIQGGDSTLAVRLDDMVYHTQAAARGCRRALLISEMPFMSYQPGPRDALISAGRLMAAGARMVKLEGGTRIAETVRALTDSGIPVCGHLGLTPQSVYRLGGYRVQGREEKAAARMRADAQALEQAGASLVVLEAVPRALARQITGELSIPTIGIGAGVDCDGQVLVLHDMLGLYPDHTPKFVRNFMDGADSIEAAVRAYLAAVRSGEFPAQEHGYD